MILKLKQTPGIYLAGFMASGKTTIGRILAERIGWHFADLDDDIVSAAGMPIPRIFEERGEPEFRRIESEAVSRRIQRIKCGEPTVVALGGGTYSHSTNADLIESSGISVWLDCPLEMVERRVAGNGHRPLARDPERFRELYRARREAYSRAAYRVEVLGDDAERTVGQILDLPVFHL